VVRNLVLILAGAFVFAGTVRAQEPTCEGKFTLPFEAQWGSVTLPAGGYAFTLNSTAVGSRVVTVVRDQQKVAIVMAQGRSKSDSTKASALIVTRSGGRARIDALHLAEVGDFFYVAPKAEGLQTASTPQFIQRIPVSTEGK
jgi:hypothetical protein